ncbi:hypothetical protein V3C99_005413 [Haemonchus contortus]
MLAKAALAKAKNTETDAPYEKLDSKEGEKFVFRVAKARHRATQNTGVMKSVRNSEGGILRKPSEVRRHVNSLVKDMNDGSTKTIRVPHGQTGAIDVTVGVHQGSALSPFLFLLTMDVITEEVMDEPLKTILYADDIALIAESKGKLQDKPQNGQRVLAENGLRLDVKKTKFLNSGEGTESIVDARGEAIEKVRDFRYLVSDLAADGSMDQAVKSRINAA